MRKLPSSVKKAKDTFRQKREKDVYAPELVDDVRPPAVLSAEGKEHWNELAPLLHKVLTAADKKMLMALCEELAKYWRYQFELQAEDIILELKNGKGKVINYMKNPKLDLSDKALSNIQSIAIHFGLTPLSRTKINVQPAKHQSPEASNQSKLQMLRSKAAGKVVALKAS